MNKKQKVENKDEQLVEKLKNEIAELTDSLQRERADAINSRRRYEEQISRLKTSVKADIVSDLLPVIDNFERAIKHIPDDIKNHNYAKGITAIIKQFETTLQDMGVSRIKTKDEPFDPSYHEAVSSEGEGEGEIVSEELQPGYLLGEEIIRSAKVKVRKH